MRRRLNNLLTILFEKVFQIGILKKNVNNTSYSKNCIMMYITSPFEKIENNHQNEWQAVEIARLIGKFGYNVDVMDYYFEKGIIDKKYDAIFEITSHSESFYYKYLVADPIKVMYITGSNPIFANEAEQKRLKELMCRRGVMLSARRETEPFSKAIELYNSVCIIGNDITLKTYSDYNLPQTFLIPNSGYDFWGKINVDTKRSDCFIYFGSSGSVHKGLDRLLEIFSKKDFPCDLYVCGSYENETDFCKEYSKEIYHTKNIIPMGFLNISDKRFFEIVNRCAFTILPSCSEGMAGTITTMMSAGVIPICSLECGIDSEDIIVLEDCEIDTIERTILWASKKSKEWVKTNSIRTMKLASNKYSRSIFSQKMEEALEYSFRNNDK